MGRGQNLLNLVKSIKQAKEMQTIQEEIKEVIKPENLKAGVTAFGIEGNKNIVDTSDANLLYYNYYLHPSYTAYAKGSKIKGSMQLCNSTKPFSLGNSCTVVNPEDPYFILTEQYASGSFQGRIVKLKNSAVNPEWIEGKSICVRANYNPSITYWSKPWHVEINVIEDEGGHFYFKSSSGYMSIIGKNAAGVNCDYITYSAFCNNLDEITVESWTKNVIKASNYMSDSLGKSGTIYCYSRNSSIKSTGLTGSTGIPSSADKILFNIKTSGLRYYVENDADLYYPVSKDVIANAINLTSDQIVEGNTILNVVGTAKTGANFTITNGKYLFAESARLELIDTLLPLCDITTAESMFYFYPSADLDCSKLNTSKVENMSRMFMQSQALTNLNIGHFDMSNVTNMTYMFTNCTKLSDETLNIILLLCSNASNITHEKSLKAIGLTEDQALICTNLSNYQTFLDADWIDGYDLDVGLH